MLRRSMLLLLSTSFSIYCSTIETDEQRLVNAIFENYNKKLRPVVNTSDVIKVDIYPQIFSILETDEAAESITIVLWFELIWKDAFLQWNPSEYGGLQELIFPLSDVWYPDVIIFNINNIEVPIPSNRDYAYIYADGTVDITIDQVLTTFCEYQIAMFPFDIQNCSLNIASWMHNANEIDIIIGNNNDMRNYNKNNAWDMISMTGRKSTVFDAVYNHTWINTNFDIAIQRKPTYYLLTFVLPSFMIMTVSIIGIFAPFNDSGDREEKVTMGLTNLLTMTVILTLIADKMPKSSMLPLLGTYILLQISIAAVTSLIAVLIMYQNCKRTFGEPVPEWILTVTRLNRVKKVSLARKTQTSFMFSNFLKVEKTDYGGNGQLTTTANQQTIVLRNVKIMVRQIVNYIQFYNEKEKLRKEWQHATQRLDLILMIVFLAINCICTALLLITGFSNLRV